MWIRLVAVLVLLLGLVPGVASRGARGEVTISAAISLKPALEKAQGMLEAAAGEKISFNFGASGSLAGQIQQGAPVDLFLSADRATVQKLLDAKAVEAGSDKAFAGNELVLIVRQGAVDAAQRPTGFADLAKARRVAMGDPAVVPAGNYARQVLTFFKVYDELDKAGKLVKAENVAAVLTYVQRGDADAGLVYASDVRSANAGGMVVEVMAVAPAEAHGVIEYVGAVVSASKKKEAAGRVQAALASAAVQAVFRDLGFSPPARAASAPSVAPVDSSYLRPWLTSMEVALIATGINALVGLPLSYLLASRRMRLRWLVETLVTLPLVLPPTVVGFGLMFIIGKGGLYGWVTGDTLLFTKVAAVLASSVVSLPLLVLPLRAAFAATPREYHDEARMAGLSGLQRFIYVAIPMARGGLLSGLLLCFARALGEFGATLMLVATSEKTRTLPIQIFLDAGDVTNYARAWPAVLALAVTSAAVILVANRLRWLDAEK